MKIKKIKKLSLRFFSAALVLLTLAAASLPMSAMTENDNTEQTKIAIKDPKYDFPEGAADVSIKLDGNKILAGEAAIIGSVTYIPLRSFAELVGVDSISWNGSNRTATIKKQSTTIKISDRLQYIEASGRYFYFTDKVLNISDRIFVPIRPLCKALGVDVEWDTKTRTVLLEKSSKELASGSQYYNSDDVYWLSRIISSESAGEPLEGKIAVGNVVQNRVRHSSYPNTIYGVIFDRKHGTQFSPVSMGTIYNKPSAESIIAAKICLEGYSIDNGILFFMNPKIATTNWISQNRPFAFVIANHSFYY